MRSRLALLPFAHRLAADELLVGEKIVVHPCEVLDHKASVWEQRWAPQEVSLEEVRELFDDLRDQAQFTELDPISVTDIRRALDRMRVGTGKGVDQLSVSDLARLPDAAAAARAPVSASRARWWAWYSTVQAYCLPLRTVRERGVSVRPAADAELLRDVQTQSAGATLMHALCVSGGKARGLRGGWRARSGSGERRTTRSPRWPLARSRS